MKFHSIIYFFYSVFCMVLGTVMFGMATTALTVGAFLAGMSSGLLFFLSGVVHLSSWLNETDK